MKPIKFKQQNITYTAPAEMTDEECGALPACRHENGIISCWKMTLRERLKILFTGLLWFDVVGVSQPPIWLGVDTPFIKAKKEVSE